MERMMIAEKEYERLMSSGKISEKLMMHPGFKTAFIEMFVRNIGAYNYSIEVKDDSIVVEQTFNNPDLTNGIYHGYSSATRCAIQIEQDVDKEFLTVKSQRASVSGMPNRNTDELSYGSSIIAYDDRGFEKGCAEYYKNQEINKGFSPIMMTSMPEQTFSNPTLDVKSATRGYVQMPNSASNEKWRLHTMERQLDGVAYEHTIEHVDAHTVNDMHKYSAIRTEHPERLSGNTTEFAIGKIQGGHIEYKTPIGIDMSQEELRKTIEEHQEHFDKIVYGGKSR